MINFDHFIFFRCELALHIIHPGFSPSNYRVIWCPYVPSFEDDPEQADDQAKLLVFLNGSNGKQHFVLFEFYIE